MTASQTQHHLHTLARELTGNVGSTKLPPSPEVTVAGGFDKVKEVRKVPVRQNVPRPTSRRKQISSFLSPCIHLQEVSNPAF